MVPHGCAGSATIKIRVQIPEGVIARQADAEGRLECRSRSRANTPREYDFHGAKLSEGVKEVVWSGGKLPDDFYDEFVISTFLTGSLKPEHHAVFPDGAGMRAGRQPLDRYSRPMAPAHAHDEQVAGAGRQTDAETLERIPTMRLIAGLATLLSVLGFATGASAHASLVATEPADGSVSGGSAEDGAVALQ